MQFHKKANIKRNYTHLTPHPTPQFFLRIILQLVLSLHLLQQYNLPESWNKQGKPINISHLSQLRDIMFLALLTFPVLYDKWIESRELSRSLELKNLTADCDYTHTATVLQSHYNSSHFVRKRNFSIVWPFLCQKPSISVLLHQSEYFFQHTQYSKHTFKVQGWCTCPNIHFATPLPLKPGSKDFPLWTFGWTLHNVVNAIKVRGRKRKPFAG